jgi:hypothetical protein
VRRCASEPLGAQRLPLQDLDLAALHADEAARLQITQEQLARRAGTSSSRSP